MRGSQSVRPNRRKDGGRRIARRGVSAWPALVALLAALVLAGEAHAATPVTLHVDQHHASCSATAAGTAGEPFCTIGAAAAKAGPGTTVVVESGTYTETVKPPSGAEGDPVTFTAAPGATPIVDGGLYGFQLAGGSSWVTVKGFTVRATSSAIVVGDWVNSPQSSHLAFVGNRVTGRIQLFSTSDSSVEYNTANTIDLVGGGTSDGSSRNRIAGNAVSFGGGIMLRYGADANTVTGNVIHDNLYGIGMPSDGGSADNTIINNVLYNNAVYGIRVASADFTRHPAVLGTRVLANSLARNGGISIIVDYSSKTTLANNVIDTGVLDPALNYPLPGGGAQVAIRVDPASVPGSSIDYDVVNAVAGNKLMKWNDWSYYSLAKFTAATGQEAHGLQGDPQFAAPAEGDLTLKAGSPAVDSGVSGSTAGPSAPIALPVKDAFGATRVDDAATADSGGGPRSYDDRGAFEMRNPGFETDTTGWNTGSSSAGVTLSRVPDGHTGAGAAMLTNGGSAAGTCALNDSPNRVLTTNAGTYTATAWVRADTPGATLKLRLSEWSGATAVGRAKTTITLSTDWQPVKVRYTAAAPGASTLDLSAYVHDVPPGSCFSADDISIAWG